MKKLIICLALLSTPVLAQEAAPPAKPTAQELQDQSNDTISALQQQRDNANNQVVSLAIQINKLQREIAELKKAAPATPPAQASAPPGPSAPKAPPGGFPAKP